MDIHAPVTTIGRLNEFQKLALKKLRLTTIEDLLHHFPVRYGDTAQKKSIANLVAKEEATIFGKISNLKTGKAFIKKIPLSEATIEDDTGKIKAVWFNQPYIAKMIQEGALVRVEGKVSARRSGTDLFFSNPKIESVAALPIGVGDSLFGEGGVAHTLYPVYPESRGLTSDWIYHALQKIFRGGVLDTIVDPIPASILEKYNLPSLKTALIWIHTPQNQNDALSARKRFAFEQVFMIQLEKQRERREYEKHPTYKITTADDNIEEFLSRFPYRPTNAQERAISTIIGDFKKDYAMSRLLEGDVGSGKTLVAAATAYAAVQSRPLGQKFGHLQIAYMAPTEILATQHFESFISYFRHLPISIALITGSGCRKFPSKTDPSGSTPISRAQLLKWVANGEIPILIGTHALIQKSVKFKHLAYIVIDEQHRFGVNQRQKLTQKDGRLPHLLSMSATPIPRTLALTIFGDLDLTIIDEQPPGRKPIITEVVLPNNRETTYEKIRRELKTGRQMYVICPRIDEPDPAKEQALNVRSVKAEAERLKKKVFQEYEIDIVHSKMTPAAKDAVMKSFAAGDIHILVATSVVEVGVNVPNATVIIIEGAERFGLAQLHQLRGRVMRSTDQAYCYVFADATTEKTAERLRALTTAKNGFELAELDLKFRGAGALSGGKQWGLSDIAMEALKNIKMVEAARTEAASIIASDPDLANFPILRTKLAHQKTIHFE